VKPTPKLLKVPFDEIFLPSMGLFYEKNYSHLKVRELNGHDEILLASPFFSHNGHAIKLLFNNIILDCQLNYEDLLICDRDAILLYLRSSTYGDEVEMDFKCPECSTEAKGTFRISSVEAKELKVPPNEMGEFEFLLPSSLSSENIIQINFTPLKVSQSHMIKDRQLMSRYMTQITSINENNDKQYIFNFLKKMRINDSKCLREFMDKVEPGFEEMTMHTCNACGHVIKDLIRIDESFMNLPPNHRNSVNEECFLAYYYGKGVTRAQAYQMSVIDRKWTINRISQEIEKQNKAEQEAVSKAKKSRK